MQHLLEQQRSPTQQSGGCFGSPRRQWHLKAVLGIVALTTYAALFVLPLLSQPEDLAPSTAPRTLRPGAGDRALARPEAPTLPAVIGTATPAAASDVPVDALQPWGYNRDRNVPRWRAIASSIRRDRRARFTLVDYGADQGYFSISTAHFFPESFVVALELGGVGGEIWSKGKKKNMDVLAIQESHLDDLRRTNMLICQTRMDPAHFFALRDGGLHHDYQLILSVFHWFPLPTRREFERAVVALFQNARTTFIELPTIGDNSEMIRKQVGYENFARWYDGRTDIRQILLDAARAEGVEIAVELVLSFPWVRWVREVYRVDVVSLLASDVSGSFGCDQRRGIYGCAARDRFQSCPSSSS